MRRSRKASAARWLRVCAVPAGLWLSSSASALAQQTIATPILATDGNFRDVAGISSAYGGTGLANATSSNGVMRTGVFYRSEALTQLSAADWVTLSGLHISLDIDLRTPSEIAGPVTATAPNAGMDWVPAGANYLNVNIYGSWSPPGPSSPIASPADSVGFFESLYRGFVGNQADRTGFHDALIAMATAQGAVLFHCSAGKDRTGWTAVLLQSIAGVPQVVILNDYLATNAYMASWISATLAQVTALAGAQQAAILQPQLGVQASFLQAALDQVVAQYGSMDAYLTQGLGLTRADIYVLRAKMVRYPALPGQSGLAGNAAGGAAVLNALQDSPLSGHYTSYNYYLQSAVDSGSLGGVETQVGGQVHADAVAYLLRQPLWVDAAVAPYVTGRDLASGQSQIWMAGLGGYFGSGSNSGAAASRERSAGSMVGATHRFNQRASAGFALGYDWGAVDSAGGRTEVDTLLAMAGARYALSSLDAGPFVAARVMVGGVDYYSERSLGGGLGNARGSTGGAVYGGQAELGDVLRPGWATITLAGGLRVTHASIGGFQESGSELALAVNRISHTTPSLLTDLNVDFDTRRLGGWSVTPTVALGFELALSNPRIAGSANLYGFGVTQASAYDSRYLVKPGLGVTAERHAFTLTAGVDALLGSGSTGVNGHVSAAYRF